VLTKLRRHPAEETSPVPAYGRYLAGLSGGVAVPVRMTGYFAEVENRGAGDVLPGHESVRKLTDPSRK
jgi:hypothetical protein